MTSMEVAYVNHLENKRHNLVTEAETHRTNVANEYLKGESNRITEEHYVRQDQETYRHNVQNENISWANLAELNRHNLVAEAETNRHNLRTESLTEYSNTTARMQAMNQARYYQAQTNLISTQVANYQRELSAKELSAQGAYLKGTAAVSKVDVEEAKLAVDTVFKGIGIGMKAYQSMPSANPWQMPLEESKFRYP